MEVVEVAEAEAVDGRGCRRKLNIQRVKAVTRVALRMMAKVERKTKTMRQIPAKPRARLSRRHHGPHGPRPRVPGVSPPADVVVAEDNSQYHSGITEIPPILRSRDIG